jgi:hypothetical protein
MEIPDMTATRTIHAPIVDRWRGQTLWGRTSDLAVHVRRLSAPLGRFATRGQLGQTRESQLGRRSGARI